MRAACFSLAVLASALGCNGFSGHQGARGDMGQAGEAGAPGLPGAPGAKGPDGEDGATGERGAQGVEGAAGDAGEPGEAGPRGKAGASGEAGLGLENLYGDGIDKVVTVPSEIFLAGDMYYDSLTIAQDVTVHANGFRIFVENVLTLAEGATIDRSGGTASAGTAATLPTGTIGGGGAGQPSNDCSVTGGDVTNSLGGSAGLLSGLPSGTATAPAAAVGGMEIFDAVTAAVTGRTLDGNVVMGGAGGSACGLEPANGGGGGVVVVVARVIVLSGVTATISANGGNAVGTPAVGSGIIGGGGGVIVVVSSVPQPAGLALSVAGGASIGAGTTPGSAGHFYWLD